MEKTKVAVVGIGALGEHHARLYAESPLAELMAVVDSQLQRALRISSRYGCQALQHVDELPEDVAAVSLAVPTELHASIGSVLLHRGKHVLVEKPMASTLEEADQLMETAGNQNRVLHVGHSERFNPAFTGVRPFITRPRFFESHRMGIFVPRSLDVDVVLDLMIHDLDLILLVADQPVREIRAVGIPVLTERVDIANARIEFEDGCVANLTASRVSTDKVRKLRFFQPHEYISIDFHHQQAEVHSLAETGTGKQIVRRNVKLSAEEPLKLELEAFLRAVRGEGGAPGCSGEQGRRSLDLALQIVDGMRSET